MFILYEKKSVFKIKMFYNAYQKTKIPAKCLVGNLLTKVDNTAIFYVYDN